MAYAWATYPDSAVQFGRSLLNHLEILKTFPYVGGLVRERSGVRQLVHTPFLIYDAVFPEKRLVEVLHVWPHPADLRRSKRPRANSSAASPIDVQFKPSGVVCFF